MIVNILLCLFWWASSASVLALQWKLDEGGELDVITPAVIVLISVLIGFALGRWKSSDE